MSQPLRFFVVQVRKTAGTSLRTRFVNAFGTDGVYPNASDGPLTSLISMSVLADRWKVRGDQIRVVMGHFPMCAVEMLDAGFITITVLRDPLERTLSFLRFQKRIIPADRDKSLDQIYSEQPRFDTHIHNHMTRMFGLDLHDALAADGSMAVVDQTHGLLARAKERLMTIDEIGFQQTFPDFAAGLSERYQLDLGGDVMVNTSPGPDAPADLCRRIEADNALDRELYEFACEQLRPDRPATRSV